MCARRTADDEVAFDPRKRCRTTCSDSICSPQLGQILLESGDDSLTRQLLPDRTEYYGGTGSDTTTSSASSCTDRREDFVR
jgi:hypothetical protein